MFLHAVFGDLSWSTWLFLREQFLPLSDLHQRWVLGTAHWSGVHPHKQRLLQDGLVAWTRGGQGSDDGLGEDIPLETILRVWGFFPSFLSYINFNFCSTYVQYTVTAFLMGSWHMDESHFNSFYILFLTTPCPLLHLLPFSCKCARSNSVTRHFFHKETSRKGELWIKGHESCVCTEVALSLRQPEILGSVVLETK